jgi:hypothetical protein
MTAPEPVQKAVSEKPEAGSGKIIMMDDERMLRKLVQNWEWATCKSIGHLFYCINPF